MINASSFRIAGIQAFSLGKSVDLNHAFLRYALLAESTGNR